MSFSPFLLNFFIKFFNSSIYCFISASAFSTSGDDLGDNLGYDFFVCLGGDCLVGDCLGGDFFVFGDNLGDNLGDDLGDDLDDDFVVLFGDDCFCCAGFWLGFCATGGGIFFVFGGVWRCAAAPLFCAKFCEF